MIDDCQALIGSFYDIFSEIVPEWNTATLILPFNFRGYLFLISVHSLSVPSTAIRWSVLLLHYRPGRKRSYRCRHDPGSGSIHFINNTTPCGNRIQRIALSCLASVDTASWCRFLLLITRDQFSRWHQRRQRRRRTNE